MAFAGILSEADVTAALAACQGKPQRDNDTACYNYTIATHAQYHTLEKDLVSYLTAFVTECLAAKFSCQ